MPKYVAIRPRSARWSDIVEDDVMDDVCTVYEEDDYPTETGLVDATGTPIYRLSEKRPIGYLRNG